MDGKKEGWMEWSGRMVPRWIMVFVFRLCLLRIILFLYGTWNWHLGFYFSFLKKRLRGEALAKFLPIARFGHYEFNGRGPMLWEAFVWPKNRFKVFSPNWVLVIFAAPITTYHTAVIKFDEMLLHNNSNWSLNNVLRLSFQTFRSCFQWVVVSA